MKTIPTLALVSSLFLPSFAFAADAPPTGQLSADEVAQLRALLHNTDSGNELSPQQADSVRGLIKETNADSDFISAGFDDKGKLFIKTQDDAFLLNIGGLIQSRYVWNRQPDRNAPYNFGGGAANNAESVNGFALARAELSFNGKVNKDFFYTLKLQKNSGANTVELSDAFVGWQANDAWAFQTGYFRAPFGRENLLGNANQTGVERSLAANRFDFGRSEGLQAQYSDESVKAIATIHNQTNSGLTGFKTTSAIATTERLEYLASGKWGDLKDNYGLADARKQALLFGASANYTQYSANSTSTWTTSPSAIPTTVSVQTQDSIAWTVDATWKIANWSLFGAAYGLHDDNTGPTTATRKGADTDHYGFTAQADYRFAKQWDAFARYDHLTDGNAAAKDTTPIQAVTLGTNYQWTSKVRVSGDVVWVTDGDALAAALPGKTGNEFGNNLGLTAPPAGHSAQNQTALRLQIQIAL